LELVSFIFKLLRYSACEKVPNELINQLKEGGRLVIPVGPNVENQFIYIIDKDQYGNVSWIKTVGVVCFI